MAAQKKLHASFLEPLIFSLMANGALAEVVNYAVAQAQAKKEWDKATRFRDIGNQISDFYSQSGDGRPSVTIP